MKMSLTKYTHLTLLGRLSVSISAEISDKLTLRCCKCDSIGMLINEYILYMYIS